MAPQHDESRAPEPFTFPKSMIGWRFVWFALVLVAVELGLKYAGGFGWWAVNETSARYGWRMLPNQDARSRDLSIVETINSMGFRDREWDEPRLGPDGTPVRDPSLFRVAITGNSFTYGTSVEVERTYPRLLEGLIQEELDRRGVDRRALVMNFSVQGYGLEQQARVFDDVIRDFRPDLLIIPSHSADPKPFVPSMDPPHYDFREWVQRTATFDMLSRHVINRWVPPAPPPPPPPGTQVTDWAAIEKGMIGRPFDKEYRELWDQADVRMEGLLEDMEQDGGRLVIVALPRYRKHFQPDLLDAASHWTKWCWERRPRVPIVVPWPRFRELQQPVTDELLAKGIVTPTDTTHDLTERTWTDDQGVEHRGDELDTADRSLHLLFDMGHLSALGHRVMAEEIFEVLRDDGVLPGGS